MDDDRAPIISEFFLDPEAIRKFEEDEEGLIILTEDEWCRASLLKVLPHQWSYQLAILPGPDLIAPPQVALAEYLNPFELTEENIAQFHKGTTRFADWMTDFFQTGIFDIDPEENPFGPLKLNPLKHKYVDVRWGYEHKKSGIAFPQKLGELAATVLTNHILNDKVWASLITYQGDFTTAVIYLSDPEHETLENGIDMEAILVEMQRAMHQAAEAYQDIVEDFSSLDVHVVETQSGQLPFVWTRFMFDFKEGNCLWYSWVFLAAYHGQFMKIRFDLPQPEAPNGSSELLDDFLSELGSCLYVHAN